MEKYIDGKGLSANISILGTLKLCNDYSLIFRCQTWIPYEKTKERTRNTVFSFIRDFYDTRIKIFFIGNG